MDLLPEDVLADVLSRMAPRTLAISRSVCKGWRAAADADARCQEQLRRAAELLPVTLGGMFVRTNEAEPTAFFARPSMAHRIAGDLEHYLRMVRSWDSSCIVDCCNGLILLDDVHMVVNPATKQWARLPPYPTAFLTQKERQGSGSGDDYHYRFLAFDPALSPHYEVLAIRGPPYRKDGKLSEGGQQEWPPSVYVARVYSSRTGRWEERSFVREEGADVRSGFEPWKLPTTPHCAYRNGALYLYWTDCITRITLSSDKYQVINLPAGIDASKNYHLCLGKSRNGVHFALLDYQHRLQVWFLDETDGKIEWVLKHGANLEALKLFPPEHTDRPWILQEGNYDKRSNREPILEKEMDWYSDDDNAADIEEVGKKYSCLYIEVFGFHPYREIIFLFLNHTVVAYYFNSSKVQELGELRIKHRYQIIDEAFMYTPCWAGDLSENN
ncbi:unnamed protein product [Urochloa humidicola]